MANTLRTPTQDAQYEDRQNALMIAIELANTKGMHTSDPRDVFYFADLVHNYLTTGEGKLAVSDNK